MGGEWEGKAGWERNGGREVKGGGGGWEVKGGGGGWEVKG